MTPLRRHHTHALLATAAVLASACAPMTRPDTARTLPAGELQLGGAFEIGAIVTDPIEPVVGPYELYVPDEVPDDRFHVSNDTYPGVGVHLAVPFVLRWGVTDGLELQGQVDIAALAWGLAAGLKWQLLGAAELGTDDTALALTTRAGYHVAIYSDLFEHDVYHQLYVEGGPVVSFGVGGDVDLTVHPRTRYDWVGDQDCLGGDKDNNDPEQPWRHCSGDALWVGGGVGVAFTTSPVDHHAIELGALYAVPIDERDVDDLWMPLLGYRSTVALP